MTLSATQRDYLQVLRNANEREGRPSWRNCSVPQPTVDALVKAGEVIVREAPELKYRSVYYHSRQWCDAKAPLPRETIQDVFARLVVKAASELDVSCLIAASTLHELDGILRHYYATGRTG